MNEQAPVPQQVTPAGEVRQPKTAEQTAQQMARIAGRLVDLAIDRDPTGQDVERTKRPDVLYGDDWEGHVEELKHVSNMHSGRYDDGSLQRDEGMINPQARRNISDAEIRTPIVNGSSSTTTLERDSLFEPKGSTKPNLAHDLADPKHTVRVIVGESVSSRHTRDYIADTVSDDGRGGPTRLQKYNSMAKPDDEFGNIRYKDVTSTEDVAKARKHLTKIFKTQKAAIIRSKQKSARDKAQRVA